MRATSLFAALNVLDDTVKEQTRNTIAIRIHPFPEHARARHPRGTVVHVILDNYAAHKHAKVRARLGRHPRWTFHFTPTSCSWLNAVEGFFAKLTRRRVKRGVFHSIVGLLKSIGSCCRITSDVSVPYKKLV
jgi:transposase